MTLSACVPDSQYAVSFLYSLFVFLFLILLCSLKLPWSSESSNTSSCILNIRCPTRSPRYLFGRFSRSLPFQSLNIFSLSHFLRACIVMIAVIYLLSFLLSNICLVSTVLCRIFSNTFSSPPFSLRFPFYLLGKVWLSYPDFLDR